MYCSQITGRGPSPRRRRRSRVRDPHQGNRRRDFSFIPLSLYDRRTRGLTVRNSTGKTRFASKTLRKGSVMSVLLEFSMSPLDKGDSVGDYVARSLDIVDKSGVDYRLNPMGTVLEGEWDQVMAVVTRCYERMSQDCQRISVSIKIDARKNQSGRLSSKIASVEKRLGRSVKTS